MIVDRAYAEYTTYSSFTTIIPQDDTIPQNTEGTELLTASITPKLSTNIIRVRFFSVITLSAINTGVGALFKDSGANALAACQFTSPIGNYLGPLYMEYEESAANTSARTYKIRVGPGSTATLYINGNSSSRIFGGIARSTLVIEEIQPP